MNNRFDFPVDRENPIKFIEYTFVNVSAIDDVNSLNEALVAFLQKDTVQFLKSNPELFYITGEVWLAAIKRVVLCADDIAFPDGLLSVPPLFTRLNWIENRDSWEPVRLHIAKLFKDLPCVPHLLALLFVEAMQYGLETAMEKYDDRCELLPEIEFGMSQYYRSSLSSFGWPELERIS